MLGCPANRAVTRASLRNRATVPSSEIASGWISFTATGRSNRSS